MRHILIAFTLACAGLLPMQCFASIAVSSSANHAQVWQTFNKTVDDKTDEIKALVFGPITKIIGMLALAYAIISVWMTNSYRQLVVFGGVGILMTIAPSFIDTLFSALLPRM